MENTMSDVEFVNVYMGKLKNHLNDQLTKIIMLETHLEIAGNTAKGLQEEIADLTESKEELIKTNEGLMDEVSDLKKTQEDTLSKAEQLYAEKESLKTNVSDLNAEIDRLRQFEIYKGEVDALKSQINTLQSELESARKREENMIADYQKLSVEYSKLEEKTKASDIALKPPVTKPKIR